MKLSLSLVLGRILTHISEWRLCGLVLLKTSVYLIKNFAKPRLFSVLFMTISAMVRRMMCVFAGIAHGWIVGLRSWHSICARCRPFDQLVKFTPIKPNAPAMWTVINFNTLTFGHQEVGVWASRAFHRNPVR